MYVRCNPNKNNIKYLSYVQGYRDEFGNTRQKTIKKIGNWEDLIKLYDDPIAHYNKIAKDEEEKLNNELLLKLSETIDDNINNKNLGYIALKKVYEFEGSSHEKITEEVWECLWEQ